MFPQVLKQGFIADGVRVFFSWQQNGRNGLVSPGCKLKACNWGRCFCPGKVPSPLEQPLDKQRLSSSCSSKLASPSSELLGCVQVAAEQSPPQSCP